MSDTAQILTQSLVAAPAARVRDYVDLLKPRVMSLVVFTGLIAVMIAPGHLHPFTAALAVLAIALGSGAAGAINMWFERDLDAVMARTRLRPLPMGRVAPDDALGLGVLLSLFSVLLMAVSTNFVAATLLATAILFYVFVYTIWLKPRSIWNAVIGGAAGAAAPLIADAAVNGSIGLAGWSLFAIVFFWQPPHVWAIALYRKADYAAAGIPMPPSVIGDEATRRRVVAYTAGLLPVTLAPYFFGLVGPIYFAIAGSMGLWFLYRAVQLFHARTDEAARGVFRVSLVFLFSVFLAMMLDLMVPLEKLL